MILLSAFVSTGFNLRQVHLHAHKMERNSGIGLLVAVNNMPGLIGTPPPPPPLPSLHKYMYIVYRHDVHTPHSCSLIPHDPHAYIPVHCNKPQDIPATSGSIFFPQWTEKCMNVSPIKARLGLEKDRTLTSLLSYSKCALGAS